MSLSGLVLIRNGLELDYCFREAIESLLPVCEEVVVSDGESTDGTQELIRDWQAKEPKIKLCIYKWPNPKADVDFYVDWIQQGRHHCQGTHLCHLDADEVLDERNYSSVLKYAKEGPNNTLRCKRLNFWRDAQTLIPPGVCLGHEVIRLAPQPMWLPSDGIHPLGGDAVMMAKDSRITIYHYGFLRRTVAYFEKSKRLHGYFFGTYDERLKKAEEVTKDGGNWMSAIENVEWTQRLVPYDDPHHPAVARDWLRSRGYSIA